MMLIVGNNYDPEKFILGQIFMHNYYIVYDYEN
jgi:hypothetical protein